MKLLNCHYEVRVNRHVYKDSKSLYENINSHHWKPVSYPLIFDTLEDACQTAKAISKWHGYTQVIIRNLDEEMIICLYYNGTEVKLTWLDIC